VAERIRVTFDTDLRRGRLAVLLRLPVALAPAVALTIWTVAAAALLVASWPVIAVRGRVPRPLHRFQLHYLRNWTRFVAWLALVSAPRGVAVEAERIRQQRATVLLRPLLVSPAVVLASVLTVALAWTAVGAWVVALAGGRTTEGLRELGAFCIRYQAETLAYLLLLTPSAPMLAPPTREAR
jgi:Domain of unknown function (DUF4389)